MSAISGAISFGIGSLATSSFGVLVSVGKAAFEAGMHAITSGLMSALDGGNFGSGFLSGMLSSAISSVIEGLGQTGKELTGYKMEGGELKSFQYAEASNFGKSPYFKAVMITSGGLSGGIGATIAGGDFWKGLRQGLITAGLNHVAHLGAAGLGGKKDSTLAVLEDTEGASDFGHMGLAGGNDNKGWSYLSKDGRADSNNDGNQDGTLVTGGKSTQTYEVNKYKTFSDLLKAHPQYDKYVTYKVTYQQVQAAFAAGYQDTLTNYHVLFSNCGHTVSAALNAVGLYGGIGTAPNDRFKAIQNFINTGSVYYQSTRAFVP